MKKKTLIIVSSLLILVIAGLLYGNSIGLFGEKGNFKEIEITKLELIDIIEMVAATGKIQPEIEVKLSSEVSGEIISLPIVEGQQVKKGDILVKVNPDLYQSALKRSQASYQNNKAGLDQAEAQLVKAKADYDRNKTLFEKGIISKADWDQVISSYDVAKASRKSSYYSIQSAAATVNEARENLSRTTIVAPIDGTISKLDVELGERVLGTQQFQGTEILRVADLRTMEVEVDVNENDIVKIEVGDSTIVEVDAYLKKEFRGIVTEIANSAEGTLTADQVTNFKVKVRILPASYKDLTEGRSENYSPFRPGMTATVDIITNTKTDIIGVPISAVVIKTDTIDTKKTRIEEKSSVLEEKFECVYVKNGSEAKLRVITTGIQDDSNIEILSGLKVGDTVITGPYTTVTKLLKTGDKVKIKKEDDIEDEDE